MHRELIRLTALGAVTGLLSGLVVLAFRWVIEVSQRAFLPDGVLGNYEALPPGMMLALPIGGGLLLGLAFERLPEHLRSVGIVHAIQQLRHTGRPDLPLGNAVVQFFAGAFAIVCGHSVDREGPGVHLGAASGTWIGARSEDAETFTLTVCGAAAAIAAAFNTPLAGIVFVIEVLGVRYRVDRFIPVMTASVIGAIVSQVAYGATPTFDLAGHLQMASLTEVLPIGMLGLVTGLLAVAFVSITERTWEWAGHLRPSLAFTLAGLATGLIGLLVPQVPGISYDTLNHILNNHLGLATLAALVAGKLIATAIAIGLRVPGGLIGPSLVIGGALGGVTGFLAQYLAIPTGNEAFYAAVGMIAMMSAVLRAPLAALMALLELTANPSIIFPGMVAVVFADVVARQLLNRESIFEHVRRLSEVTPGERVEPPKNAP
jgi:chloride channel protein, CIC family